MPPGWWGWTLSGTVPQWLSDCLCRASTGDGDVRRALYTDSDVSVIAFRRVVIFNGVDVVVTQGDLADRLLRVKLPRVQMGYLKDSDVDRSWSKAHPHILGALLDLAAKVHPVALRQGGQFPADGRLRCGAGRRRRGARDRGTEALPGAVAHIATNTSTTRSSPPYRLTPQLRRADLSGDPGRPPSDDTPLAPPKGWPTSAQIASGQLTRHAPGLRSRGGTSSTTAARTIALCCSGRFIHQRRSVNKPRKPRRPRKSTITGVQTTRKDARAATSLTPEDAEDRPRSDTKEAPAARAHASHPSHASHEAPHLSCEDEAASPARPNYEPSLVDEDPASSQGKRTTEEWVDDARINYGVPPRQQTPYEAPERNGHQVKCQTCPLYELTELVVDGLCPNCQLKAIPSGGESGKLLRDFLADTGVREQRDTTSSMPNGQPRRSRSDHDRSGSAGSVTTATTGPARRSSTRRPAGAPSAGKTRREVFAMTDCVTHREGLSRVSWWPKGLYEDARGYLCHRGPELDLETFERYLVAVGRNNAPTLLFDLVYLDKSLDVTSVPGAVASAWSDPDSLNALLVQEPGSSCSRELATPTTATRPIVHRSRSGCFAGAPPS